MLIYDFPSFFHVEKLREVITYYCSFSGTRPCPSAVVVLKSLLVINNLKDKEIQLIVVLKLVFAGVYCPSASSSIRDKQHNLTENVALPTLQQRLENCSTSHMEMKLCAKQGMRNAKFKRLKHRFVIKLFELSPIFKVNSLETLKLWPSKKSERQTVTGSRKVELS